MEIILVTLLQSTGVLPMHSVESHAANAGHRAPGWFFPGAERWPDASGLIPIGGHEFPDGHCPDFRIDLTIFQWLNFQSIL
jgi:hypothetical protein